MSVYVPRPTIDQAIEHALQQGTGVFALEGPAGAGKSAALLQGLVAEVERRAPAGRGYVRLVQLWGDEPPSLFARRLVREASHLHLVSYPQPERLKLLIESMAAAVPHLGMAGKLLAALIPDDLRPLARVTRDALSEIGDRAIGVPGGGPLVLGVDLLGGEPGAGMRDYFARLSEDLPPTVVLVVAQPAGGRRLVTPPQERVIPVGALQQAEVRAYLRQLIGPAALVPATEQALTGGDLSLMPGDLAQLVNFLRPGDLEGPGLSRVAEMLRQDVAARYQALYEREVERPGGEPLACELCAWVAVAARPDRPLLPQDTLRRLGLLGHSGTLADSGETTALWRLRRAELVQALCATVVPMREAPSDLDAGWPLAPRHGQARLGVLRALRRHGLLDVFQQRWLDELLQGLRQGPETPGTAGLASGVQAMGLLMEWLERAPEPAVLGQAVALLGEMETVLWRAGWHRTFAELYDDLLPLLHQAGVAPRDVAPALYFRRARARIQGVDWSGQEALAELTVAHREVGALGELSEVAVLQARSTLGLATEPKQVLRWCRHLPYKALQARAYARVLAVVCGVAAAGETDSALDEILLALGHFAATDDRENLAQSLTILADVYSVRGSAAGDGLALRHYGQALEVGQGMAPPPAFCLGVVWRSLGKHHERHGRGEAAREAYAEARRWLLRSPDSAMGTLLAGLTPG